MSTGVYMDIGELRHFVVIPLVGWYLGFRDKFSVYKFAACIEENLDTGKLNKGM